MRYPYGFVVTIPFSELQDDGSTAWKRALLSSNDDLDRRRIKRVIRRWVKVTLGRNLYTHELLSIMKQVIKHDMHRMYIRG